MHRGVIKHATPRPARIAYRRIRLWLTRRRNARLELAEVFKEIYERGEWGGGAAGDFVSGSGSSVAQTTDYVAAVVNFIQSRGVRSLVDLGCGDFRVGNRIVSAVGDSLDYVGVDVVPDLIKRNQHLFGSDHVRFVCRNIVDDQLPEGDVCLLYQVLQHLSNAEIIKVLASANVYPYVLITEHYPAPGRLRKANRDKPHGADTRVADGSAVALDRLPFELTGLELFNETEEVTLLYPKVKL
jgi:SAM-dependent methyltransferase